MKIYSFPQNYEKVSDAFSVVTESGESIGADGDEPVPEHDDAAQSLLWHEERGGGHHDIDAAGTESNVYGSDSWIRGRDD